MKAIEGLVIIAGTCLAMTACAAQTGDSSSSAAESLACQTPNATYVVTFTEESGDCGPLPQQTMRTDTNANVSSSESCTSASASNCTQQVTGCTWSANGNIYTQSSESTFQPDGSSASGVMDLSVQGAINCSSVYSITITRKP